MAREQAVEVGRRADADMRLPKLPELWTGSQRGVLIALLALLVLYLAVRFTLNPLHVSDPQPVVPPRYDELADRIDPNTADWQALAALPALGEKRAKTIIEYRETFARQNPHRPAFVVPEDLMNVRGIGPAMTATLRPYLLFPATRPASGPSS